LLSTERTLDEARASAASLVEVPKGWKPSTREAEIMAVLAAPIVGTSKAGYEQKEQALCAELAQLDPAESAALAARLRNAHAGDPIAAAVARMIPERRARIQAFLAGARRRAAVQTARRPAAPAVGSVQVNTMGAPVSSLPTAATMQRSGIGPDLHDIAPIAPQTIGASHEVDHAHPTDNAGVNAGGQAAGGFLTHDQRVELNAQVRFRLTTVARNYHAALTILEVEQMIKKPDELGFFLTLLLGVAESLLTAYGGAAIKALCKPGAAKAEIKALDTAAVAARSVASETNTTVATTAAAATEGEVETAGKKAEKSMLSLTEMQLNSLLKTSLSEGKKKTSSGLNPATSDEAPEVAKKAQSMSYIDHLKKDADHAFDQLDQDVALVSDGVALAYLRAFNPDDNSEAMYKDLLREKVERYIASPVSKIGRSMEWEPSALGGPSHVEREVRIVRVLVPGYGTRYAAQDSVFSGFVHDHPGTIERSRAYDASSGALSLNQDATWNIDGKEQQHHETRLRPDKVLNYIEPEFEELARKKQEQTWQTPMETYQLTFANGQPRLVKIAGA
jgi:hypothetical protein